MALTTGANSGIGLATVIEVARLGFDSVAQVMHIGPFAAEGPTIERLHAFIAEKRFVQAGRHHEIYLGEPRMTATGRLRTVIRQPVCAH